MHIILTGATGTLGLATLQHILSSPSITRLSILSRRPVSLAEGHEKVEVIIHKDFESYPDEVLENLKGAKGCVWALGISQTKVGKEEYIKITHDYPIAAAKAFSTLSDSFNFVYISGEGADQSEKTYTLFGKIKGRTERTLISLPSSSPSYSPLRIYNLRPGYINPTTSANPIDRTRSFSEKVMMKVFSPIVSLAPGLAIPSDKCGEYAVRLACGDGEPVSGLSGEKEGVLDGGRTLRNSAIRKGLGL